MYILVTYDVNTQLKEGRHRVAKHCLDFGQRVQQSVLELNVDGAQRAKCKNQLADSVDAKVDGLRYYFLGNDWRRRVEQFGVQTSFDVEGPLFAWRIPSVREISLGSR